jgi:two-component system, OmpR family, KDP operon response regulator KdpE
MKAPAILVIDDEPQIRRTLSDALSRLPARMLEAKTAADALALVKAECPDLVVLDLGLPDASGLQVCTEIRRWSNMPIVVLSARHAEAEKVQLLNAGADDYVSKPFSLSEFAARVQAQLRRAGASRQAAKTIIELDGLTIDLTRRQVRRGDARIRLTPTEWLILQTLAEHAGSPVSHQQIFDAVWGRAFGNPKQYLRVFVTHLRRKIERNPAVPRIIVTEPGFGYRFGHDMD